ncbi:hypothetical protein IE81DRAFT_324278 [Ceraceosorus guamensis]|uniref:Uncharacterized protein n=1 Tax=Ceraceosorus guamensis TaxID=1522189 RepID=A0A316VVY1_9BASI|nr:hypothetical protein IE81DRAFT_324278 [Ceraceosorus guamensis]PWN41650.1 hypothetical protein IE81DRAFT_324278 [Ceraceosorus guamensis]
MSLNDRKCSSRRRDVPRRERSARMLSCSNGSPFSRTASGTHNTHSSERTDRQRSRSNSHHHASDLAHAHAFARHYLAPFGQAPRPLRSAPPSASASTPSLAESQHASRDATAGALVAAAANTDASRRPGSKLAHAAKNAIRRLSSSSSLNSSPLDSRRTSEARSSTANLPAESKSSPSLSQKQASSDRISDAYSDPSVSRRSSSTSLSSSALATLNNAALPKGQTFAWHLGSDDEDALEELNDDGMYYHDGFPQRPASSSRSGLGIIEAHRLGGRSLDTRGHAAVANNSSQQLSEDATPFPPPSATTEATLHLASLSPYPYQLISLAYAYASHSHSSTDAPRACVRNSSSAQSLRSLANHLSAVSLSASAPIPSPTSSPTPRKKARAPTKVLDLGCGAGVLSLFASSWPSVRALIARDPDSAAIDLARASRELSDAQRRFLGFPPCSTQNICYKDADDGNGRRAKGRRQGDNETANVVLGWSEKEGCMLDWDIS